MNTTENSQNHLLVSLRELLHGRICVVGMGNRQRGDDAAGPSLVDARRDSAGGIWLDVGVAPENFLEPIVAVQPDGVLIVDAVDFGGAPGVWRLLEPTSMEMSSISTHACSLALLHKYLSARTDAWIRVVGIQPATTGLNEGLSDPVQRTVTDLAHFLCEMLPSTENI